MLGAYIVLRSGPAITDELDYVYASNTRDDAAAVAGQTSAASQRNTVVVLDDGSEEGLCTDTFIVNASGQVLHTSHL